LYGLYNQAKKVEYKTMLMMLKFEQLKSVPEAKYYFCTNSNCDVVYFSKEAEKTYKKQDIRIRVGIKETTEPKHICYCFDITEKQIIDELKSTGEKTILNFITEKIQNKLCACNIKNPSGKCCLGDVKEIKVNIK
jgi:hypothetical protein